MRLFGQRKKATGNESDEKIVQGGKDLEDIILKLTKETGIDVSKQKARVVVVMDHSWSIRPQFEDGTIQEILNTILPFAIQFDDNGQLEVFLFDDVCRKINKEMNTGNYKNYVKKQILQKKYAYGGTQYAPAIEMTDKCYNDKESKNIPTIVFFITDGANFEYDKNPSNQAIVESSKHGIFYMFIGVGNNEFSYLKHLDDLKGREYDNTGFMKFDDFRNISNVEMFTNALKDYIPWLKAKGYIR